MKKTRGQTHVCALPELSAPEKGAGALRMVTGWSRRPRYPALRAQMGTMGAGASDISAKAVVANGKSHRKTEKSRRIWIIFKLNQIFYGIPKKICDFY